jgi:hypothetical protein
MSPDRKFFRFAAATFIAVASLTGCTNDGKHIGGVWVPPTPRNNAVITDHKIELAFEAYPDKGYPGVQEVDFTATWKGQEWFKACQVTIPTKGDIYTCDIDLSSVTAGGFTVSADVTSKSGEINLAPNGTRDYYLNLPQNKKALRLFEKSPKNKKGYSYKQHIAA